MWYAIISQDNENSLPLRKKHRPAHLARLEYLVSEERLLIAGPHPLSDREGGLEGFSGSLVVADFDSLTDAQSWAEQDPFMLNGVYQSVTVKPFKKVLP